MMTVQILPKVVRRSVAKEEFKRREEENENIKDTKMWGYGRQRLRDQKTVMLALNIRGYFSALLLETGTILSLPHAPYRVEVYRHRRRN